MACGGGCCGPKNTTTTTVKPEVRPEDLTEPPTETTSNAIATTQPNVHATLTPSDSEPTAASCSTLTNPEHAPTKPKSSCCSPSDPTKSEMSKSPCGSSKPAATPKPSTSCCSSSAPKEPKPASACCQPSDSQKSKTPESCCSSPMPAKQEVINSCCSSPDSVKPNRTSSCCSPSALVKPKPATSCCKPPTPLKTETRAYDDDSSSSRSPSKVNPAPACAADATDDCCADDGQGVSTDTCGDSCCEPERIDCADTTPEAPKASCCTSPPKACATSGAKTSCCPPTNASKSCADKKAALINTTEIANGSDNIDVEKGDVAREHVVISVSGMTCTGCETKLQRTLGSLDYVSRLQTSLVLARVELDINTKLGTADDVVKHLHRTTEFKCEIVSNQGCSLDLICSGDPAAFVNGQWPDGVLDVRRLNKDTIRVDYDAKIVGARDLMNDEWSRSLQLAPPCPDSSLQAGSRHVRNMGLLTLLSAALTIPVLVMAWAPLPEREIAYGSASLALATIVQVVIAGPFYPKALKALVFSKVIEMDLLIVLSTSAAYIFSVVSFGYLVSGNPLSTGEFFETSTLLVTLIMVGRWVASLARQKAAESISIRSLQTPTAVLVDDDGTEKEIDARMLQYGDTFRVAPDSRIPTDGTVISGSSEIDESMLTGEAQPVEKHTKSAVIAGTINGSGTLTVRLTRLPGDNTITTIAGMVDEAKLSKPKIQEIADTVASYFVPVVVALTIITFVIWVAIGVAVRHQSGSEATIEAITYAITVLIVSCPCAIGLAVPMVIVIASGVAAKRGVVFKTAGSIEVAYRTTDVVFDKTGTLTAGKLAVVREEYVEGGNADDASLLLGLLGNVKHPVSAAIATHLASQGVPATTIPDAKVVTGKGVQGTVNGKKLRAGNARWLALSGDPRVGSMLSQGFTTFCFTIDNTLVAVFGLQDTLRLDAASTVDHLQRSCINVHVLSGDDDGAVRKIASQLNIPEDNVRSRCSPADKQAYIQSLLAAPSTAPLTGKSRKPIVMFVGDGTNDAVALAQATIGVHVSSGTDIAQSAADVVLVRPSLAGVLTIINVSRKAIHRIVFNFSWSFVYNTFAVLLGAGAFVRARIPPEFAGLGELVSVLPVVLAAVLLRWSKV